jgi:hypothetical protein
VLNGLTARDALCVLVGCKLTVLDEAPSDEERLRSLDGCIDLLKRAPSRFDALRTGYDPTRTCRFSSSSILLSALRLQFCVASKC